MSGARVQGGEKLSAAEEDQFRDYSTNLNPSKPMGLERMHVMVLRELADDTGSLRFVVAWRWLRFSITGKKKILHWYLKSGKMTNQGTTG